MLKTDQASIPVLLAGTVLPEMGWALFLLNALCLIGPCYSGGFPGHLILGTVALVHGTVLQWNLSPDTKDFVSRIFVGLAMGISLCGMAEVGGFMLSEIF